MSELWPHSLILFKCTIKARPTPLNPDEWIKSSRLSGDEHRPHLFSYAQSLSQFWYWTKVQYQNWQFTVIHLADPASGPTLVIHRGQSRSLRFRG